MHGVQQGVDLCWFHGEVLLRRDLQVAGALDFSKVIMVEQFSKVIMVEP